MKTRYVSIIATAIAVALSSCAAWAQLNTVSKQKQLSSAESRSQSPAQPTQPSLSQPSAQQPAESQPSQKELQQFANALKKLGSISTDAHNQILQVFKEENIAEERYNEICRWLDDPEPIPKIPPEENKKFHRADAKIKQIEQSLEEKSDQAIKDEGLSPKRFYDIFSISKKQNLEPLNKILRDNTNALRGLFLDFGRHFEGNCSRD